jgi:hypothetical protein
VGLVGARMQGSRTHHAMRGWPRILDVEAGLLLRFHSAQKLNVPRGIRCASLLCCSTARQPVEMPGIQEALDRYQTLQ